MQNQMFHVFRNSPLGRENLLQAAYFCGHQFGLSLAIRIPTHTRFLMRFESGEVTGTLDHSYVQYPETAQAHAEEILSGFKVKYSFYAPDELAGGGLPLIPVDWGIMSCPRVISEQTSRIGLGHIGPKVRGIAKHAPFPIFIPCLAYKPWNRVSIFFGGSRLGTIAVKEGIGIARLARVPFVVYTHLDGTTRQECEQALAEADLLSDVRAGDGSWQLFQSGVFEENLYVVPHDSLVVVGAAGHRLMAELIFGSKLETIQAILPNPLVVVGPNCRARPELGPQPAIDQTPQAPIP
ncbi:MAG: universal stress protein [Phycisphaerae bacterium]|nr:universal stress protein [Phycisphaerae bacterium]